MTMSSAKRISVPSESWIPEISSKKEEVLTLSLVHGTPEITASVKDV